jgi:hypothetical protein
MGSLKGVMMIAKYLSFFLSLALLSSSAFGQGVDIKNLSRLHVSEDLRSRLAERLNLFIEYELSQQYEKQYDLLANKCFANLQCGNISREEYVKGKRSVRDSLGILFELKVKGIDKKLQENCAFLSANPKLRKGKFVFTYANIMIACLQDGEWYFRFSFIDI